MALPTQGSVLVAAPARVREADNPFSFDSYVPTAFISMLGSAATGVFSFVS